MRARASADAAALGFPELIVVGQRFPETPTAGAEGNPALSEGLQARAGIGISPSNIIKGARIRDVADAQCVAYELKQRLERELAQMLPEARARALKAKATYLRSKSSEWQKLELRAEQRLAAQVITLTELGDVRRRTLALERHLFQLDGEANALAARLSGDAPASGAVATSTLVRKYLAAELDVERSQASVRSMDAWQFRVSGGLVASERPVDWYSLAELRLSLGVFTQASHLARAEAARAAELKEAARELPAQQDRLLLEARALVDQSRHELRLIEKQLAFLDGLETAADAAPERSAHARDSLRLERIALGSDRVFLQTLIAGLNRVLETR